MLKSSLMSANTLLKLPGLVDVHVHLREPGGTHKEDFKSGTKAAIAGGYTQVLDMPNNIPPTDNLNALNYKIKKAQGKIWADIGFNFAANLNSVKFFRKIYKKAFGLKVYMNKTTGSLLIGKYKDREAIFKAWQGELPVMVHAEGTTVEIAIKLARKYHRRLHVCHVTYDQLKTIQKAKKLGVEITSEVCPHHLFLNSEDVKMLGPLGMMKPPLLSKKDQEKLWENLDKIEMVSTDHAPHTLEEKRDINSPKFGVPGLETTIPLMIKAVGEKRLTLKKLIELTAIKPREVFRLPVQENTYILVDPVKKYKISQKKLFTKCGWTPFGDLEGVGEVAKVVLRGKTVFENGKFIGKPSGKVIFPKV